MLTCHYYNLSKDIKGFLCILRLKSLDYVKPALFIVNDSSFSLPNSTIIRSHVQITVIKKSFFKKIILHY